jgi:hypothetical protein
VGGAAWRRVCRQQRCVVNKMTDDEKNEILRRARATVEQGQPQALSRAGNDVLDKRRRDMPANHEPETHPYREPDALCARRLATEHERGEWFDNEFDRRIGGKRDTASEIIA